MPTLLLIEDEPSLGLIVKDSLEVRGFTVLYATDGDEGLALFQQHQPDVIVTDVMMPRLDGFTLAERIRRENASVPIVFLTARSQTADVVRGFELGGNDYLRKPFSMDELIVRVRALLARPKAAPSAPERSVIGRYEFDFPKQKLVFDGRETSLSHREAALLKRLVEQKNEVLERNDVLRDLWGDNTFFNGRSLDVFITRLRRHLQADPQIQIVNVRGIGYKLMV